jgi:hypothetical protein
MSKARVPGRQREEVRSRALWSCEYCRSQEAYSPDAFSIEHIVPRAKGGSNAAGNLALACQGCNNRKFLATEALDPVTGESARLYHPRQDKWPRHFAWNEDFTLMVGLTPTGRATVAKLELNRPGLVNLRRALCKVGLHPIPEPQ